MAIKCTNLLVLCYTMLIFVSNNVIIAPTKLYGKTWQIELNESQTILSMEDGTVIAQVETTGFGGQYSAAESQEKSLQVKMLNGWGRGCFSSPAADGGICNTFEAYDGHEFTNIPIKNWHSTQLLLTLKSITHQENHTHVKYILAPYPHPNELLLYYRGSQIGKVFQTYESDPSDRNLKQYKVLVSLSKLPNEATAKGERYAWFKLHGAKIQDNVILAEGETGKLKVEVPKKKSSHQPNTFMILYGFQLNLPQQVLKMHLDLNLPPPPDY